MKRKERIGFKAFARISDKDPSQYCDKEQHEKDEGDFFRMDEDVIHLLKSVPSRFR